MELGALVCRNKDPLCHLCPIRSYCLAYKQGRQDLIPRPKKKTIKDIQAVIAVIQKGNSYFIQKRPSKGLLADLWEFPGGKIKKGESKKQTLARELKEELGLPLRSARYLFNVKHFYTQFRVNLYVFACCLREKPDVDRGHRWVNRKDFSKYPMPSATTKIIEKL
jgi:A/G-specific adenine glycosylase